METLATIAATVTLVDHALELIRQIQEARHGIAGTSLDDAAGKLGDLKRLLDLVRDEESLHTFGVAQHLDEIRDVAEELKSFLEILAEKQRASWHTRAYFTLISGDKSELQRILHRLDMEKDSLVARIQVVHVGITRKPPDGTGILALQLVARPFTRWRSVLSVVFDKPTFVFLVQVLSLLSGIMLALAVYQTRDTVCDPQREKLHTDDGFWTLLSQLFLQLVSIYCTLYPVEQNRREKLRIPEIWFRVLLAVSFATSIAAAAFYGSSWKVATVLSFISGFAGVISAAQLALAVDRHVLGKELNDVEKGA